MTRTRRDGFYLLLIATVLFLVLSIAFEMASPTSMQDFRVLYNPARCLAQSCDPYKEAEVLRIARAEGRDRPSDTTTIRQIVTRYIYPPASFSLTLPFAMLPWGPAHVLWMTLTVGSMILASFLIWNLGATYAPILSGVMVGFLLVNCELIVISGNSAGIVVSLCVVAVWCFLQDRFVPAGILCLAVSLAVKPHDSGMVWLYFLLAGGVYRKRALQTLLTLIVLSLPGFLWVWHASPHWFQEMQSNILAFSLHGGLTDPGPAAAAANGPGLLTNLQALFSVFRDDPRFYNPATYIVCAPLLLVWIYVTLRSRASVATASLGLATIAALSLLPIYHREYDAKLLLLTVPACAMLWAEGRSIGRIALSLNLAAFVFTGDLPQAILVGLLYHPHSSVTGLSAQIETAGLAFPAPLILLIMAGFYLWVYFRRVVSDTGNASIGNQINNPSDGF
jgi:glycosyl transferase family 87